MKRNFGSNYFTSTDFTDFKRDEANRSDLADALQKQPCHSRHEVDSSTEVFSEQSRLHRSKDSRNLELELPSIRGEFSEGLV